MNQIAEWNPLTTYKEGDKFMFNGHEISAHKNMMSFTPNQFIGYVASVITAQEWAKDAIPQLLLKLKRDKHRGIRQIRMRGK
jgi:hypothetical protein